MPTTLSRLAPSPLIVERPGQRKRPAFPNPARVPTWDALAPDCWRKLCKLHLITKIDEALAMHGQCFYFTTAELFSRLENLRASGTAQPVEVRVCVVMARIGLLPGYLN